MKQKDLKELVSEIIDNYYSKLDCPLATDIYTLPLSDRISLRDFVASKGYCHVDLVRYDYEYSASEIFCTLSWLTPCYEISHVYLYDCIDEIISLYHSSKIKRLDQNCYEKTL